MRFVCVVTKEMWQRTFHFISDYIRYLNPFGRFNARPQGNVTPLSSEDDPAAAADAVGAASAG